MGILEKSWLHPAGEEENSMKSEKQKVIDRFRRIEGQIRGIAKLIESDAPCLDILTQVSAVTGAVKKAGTEVIRLSLEHCLAEAAATTAPAATERKEKMVEFQKALSRYIDMA
jgi:DNA-binding FrmR family transcriptional regulator